ncbi:hypothetical protein ACWET9_22835 [Streptomyces sp. NPDC004059]
MTPPAGIAVGVPVEDGFPDAAVAGTTVSAASSAAGASTTASSS